MTSILFHINLYSILMYRCMYTAFGHIHYVVHSSVVLAARPACMMKLIDLDVYISNWDGHENWSDPRPNQCK